MQSTSPPSCAGQPERACQVIAITAENRQSANTQTRRLPSTWLLNLIGPGALTTKATRLRWITSCNSYRPPWPNGIAGWKLLVNELRQASPYRGALYSVIGDTEFHCIDGVITKVVHESGNLSGEWTDLAYLDLPPRGDDLERTEEIVLQDLFDSGLASPCLVKPKPSLHWLLMGERQPALSTPWPGTCRTGLAGQKSNWLARQLRPKPGYGSAWT